MKDHEPVPPVTKVKSHYTINFCRACGKRVAMYAERCRACGVKLDWSVYEKEAET